MEKLFNITEFSAIVISMTLTVTITGKYEQKKFIKNEMFCYKKNVKQNL